LYKRPNGMYGSMIVTTETAHEAIIKLGIEAMTRME